MPVSVLAETSKLNWGIELQARGWNPTLNGVIQFGGVTASNLNFSNDLGVDTQKWFFWPKISLTAAERHHFSVNYLDMNLTGDKRLTQAITFGTSTFNINAPVRTEIEFKEVLVGYQYDFLTGSWVTAKVNLQVHYVKFNSQLQSPGVGSPQGTFEMAIPTIGPGLKISPYRWVQLEGHFNLFKAGIPGKRGQLLEGQAALTVSPWTWLNLSIGYRYFKLIGQDTDVGNRLDWLQKGIYIGLASRF